MSEYAVTREGYVRWPVVYVMEYMPFDENRFIGAVKVGRNDERVDAD